jgi:hypothetical protein
MPEASRAAYRGYASRPAGPRSAEGARTCRRANAHRNVSGYTARIVRRHEASTGRTKPCEPRARVRTPTAAWTGSTTVRCRGPIRRCGAAAEPRLRAGGTARRGSRPPHSPFRAKAVTPRLPRRIDPAHRAHRAQRRPDHARNRLPAAGRGRVGHAVRGDRAENSRVHDAYDHGRERRAAAGLHAAAPPAEQARVAGKPWKSPRFRPGSPRHRRAEEDLERPRRRGSSGGARVLTHLQHRRTATRVRAGHRSGGARAPRPPAGNVVRIREITALSNEIAA